MVSEEIFVKLKEFLLVIKEKTLICFSLKNLYVIFLLALLPAIFIYFEIFDLNSNLAFLILGVISFLVFIIFIFHFQNRQLKIPSLILSVLFGFLGLRLVEFFLMEDNSWNESEEALTFYFFIAFAFLLIYFFIKISRNNYSGKIISMASFILSISMVMMLIEMSALKLEKEEFRGQADRLFKIVGLYDLSLPEDWKLYSNDEYNFLFKYPPEFSENEIDENLNIRTEKINKEVFNKLHAETLFGLKTDQGDIRDDLLLIGLWQPGCIQKMSNEYKKFILCQDEFSSEKIYFINGDQLINIYMNHFIASEAEFSAMINSFYVY